MNTIDHKTLLRLVEAGAIRGTHVVGQLGGWAIIIRYGMHERSLSAQRSGQIRLFKKMDTLVAYLRKTGITQFDVNAANYQHDPLSGRRPDRAEALRKIFSKS